VFFFFPIWPNAFKFPVATVLVILAQIIVFSITWPAELAQKPSVSEGQRERAARDLLKIASAPDSGVPGADRFFLSAEADKKPFPSGALAAYFAKLQENQGMLSSVAAYRWGVAYPVFEALMKGQVFKGGLTPFEKWGFVVSAERWFPRILTHQFLHAGFLHLIFNMLFLWVVGAVMEERWGWGNVLAVFITGGMAAAGAQARFGAMPPDTVMVGASGSVSALMGAALLSSARARVKMFYFVMGFALPRYGTFNAPLWFFIPLWVFDQVWMTFLTLHSSAVQVGYFAHLGGFALGAAAGLIVPMFFDRLRHDAAPI
jgi:membrane associated rhomboid family serine protease